jgi:hypothetical protein
VKAKISKEKHMLKDKQKQLANIEIVPTHAPN